MGRGLEEGFLEEEAFQLSRNSDKNEKGRRGRKARHHLSVLSCHLSKESDLFPGRYSQETAGSSALITVLSWTEPLPVSLHFLLCDMG